MTKETSKYDAMAKAGASKKTCNMAMVAPNDKVVKEQVKIDKPDKGGDCPGDCR